MCTHIHTCMRIQWLQRILEQEPYLEFSSYPLLPAIVQLLEMYVVATAHSLLQHEVAVFLQNELKITWCMIRRVWQMGNTTVLCLVNCCVSSDQFARVLPYINTHCLATYIFGHL